MIVRSGIFRAVDLRDHVDLRGGKFTGISRYRQLRFFHDEIDVIFRLFVGQSGVFGICGKDQIIVVIFGLRRVAPDFQQVTARVRSCPGV